MTDQFKFFTNLSRFIQLHPENIHCQWAEIVGATAEGILLKITRIQHKHVYSQDPSVGEIHFKPWNKLAFKYVCEDVATRAEFEGKEKS